VTQLVARASGNMSRAARLASVDRTTLYRLFERHGFRRDFSGSGIASEQLSESAIGGENAQPLPADILPI
jgi:hypothetical protein